MNQFTDDIAEYSLSDMASTPYRNLKVWQDRWEDELVMNKVAEKTIKSYRFALKTFFDFVKRHRKIPIESITVRYINRYLIDYQIRIAKDKHAEGRLPKRDLDKLIKESKKTSIGKNDANFTVLEEFENTLSHRLTTLKIFLKFITENNKEQHDYTSLFSGLAKIKIKEKFADHLTTEELEEVVGYMHVWPDIYKDHKPKSSERYAYRDALLMLIYALSGARSDEVVHIKMKDISLHSKNSTERYIIKIVKGKGGKKRSVGIKREYLDKYIEYFKAELPSGDYYLSSTYKDGYTNKPMSPNAIRTFSNKTLKNLGINKTGLHAFRRGYATKRIGNDEAGISVVAKELGNTVDIIEKHYLKHSAEAFMK